eukprot:2751423-Alexandrium_andersonii.AAC.1
MEDVPDAPAGLLKDAAGGLSMRLDNLEEGGRVKAPARAHLERGGRETLGPAPRPADLHDRNEAPP